MKKLEKMYHRIMTKLWGEAEPSVNWSELIDSDDEVKKSFDFNKHYLEQNRFDEIVKEELAKEKLTKTQVSSIYYWVYLGCSPTSFKKNK